MSANPMSARPMSARPASAQSFRTDRAARETSSGPLGLLRGLALVVAASVGIIAGAYGALVFFAKDADWVQDVTRSALSDSVTTISFASDTSR